MISSDNKRLAGLILFGILLLMPPTLAYLTPRTTSPSYEFIDTSVKFAEDGVNSFASYESENGITIIGGSQHGMLVHRLWDTESPSIFTNSSGLSASIFDMTEWAFSPITTNPSMLAVMNRTPIVIGQMTEHYYSTLFSITGIHMDDDVIISSNPDITRVYVAYRQYLYVYNHQGQQVSMANLSAMQYGEIESVDAGLEKVVITTARGFGVYDPVENTTIACLGAPGEVFRARPAVACDEECETIYIGRKDGLHVYSANGMEYIKSDPLTKHQGLPADSVTALWLDHAARILYIGTEDGLIAYDIVDDALKGLPLQTSNVQAIFSKSDLVLVATQSGVFVLNKDELRIQPIFWEATSTFWIQLYLPGLAFIVAWTAIALQFRNSTTDSEQEIKQQSTKP